MLLAAPPARAQGDPAFDVVVLGATGGIQDGNLSAFLVRPAYEPRGVACDAGSLVNGICVAGHSSFKRPRGRPVTGLRRPAGA